MGRKQITFSVPEDVHKYIENRVDEAGYGTVSEYLRDLVRDDRQLQINRSNSANRYAAAAVPPHRHIGRCWPQPPAEDNFCRRLVRIVYN